MLPHQTDQAQGSFSPVGINLATVWIKAQRGIERGLTNKQKTALQGLRRGQRFLEQILVPLLKCFQTVFLILFLFTQIITEEGKYGR